MRKTIRTDLALEAHKLSQEEGKELEGIIVRNEVNNGLNVSVIEVINSKGEEILGKSIGTYITIECPNLRYNSEELENVCKVMSEEIRKLADIRTDSVTLVAGLGNREITPDALGTESSAQIMVTHHLKDNIKKALGDNISGVCAITPGVLGTTGMESSKTIKSISDTLKPDLIIVIDALAAADINRVASTIQISDAGIQPGAGVGNNREGINKETLGTRVIAIGVPTVIDARNISDVEIPENLSPLMVTTTDIDLVIKKCAKAIAGGINLALHENITLEEIMAFTA